MIESFPYCDQEGARADAEPGEACAQDSRAQRRGWLAQAIRYLAAATLVIGAFGCSSEAKPTKSSDSDEEKSTADDDESDDDEQTGDESKESDESDEEKEPPKSTKDAGKPAMSARTDASTPARTGDGGASGLGGAGGLGGLGGLGGMAGGMSTGETGGMPVSNQPPPDGKNCLKGTGDFNAKGPYKVKKKDVTIGSQGPYTIFYPDPLESACKHPLVAWGNGTAVTGSDTYAFYQDHAASWGIIVIASHNDNVGSGAFHKAGLDYMYAQDKEQGSEFFGKVSPRAGTSGHSQGGAGANIGASHPNVQAIGNVQGAFGTAPKGKAFLCLTGTEDIATMGCKTAVNSTSSPALYANWQGGTHTGTATLLGFITGEAGTKQYMRLYTGWFRCFLADDSKACAMFQGGADCPVCKDMGWAEIFAKNY